MKGTAIRLQHRPNLIHKIDGRVERASFLSVERVAVEAAARERRERSITKVHVISNRGTEETRKRPPVEFQAEIFHCKRE